MDIFKDNRISLLEFKKWWDSLGEAGQTAWYVKQQDVHKAGQKRKFDEVEFTHRLPDLAKTRTGVEGHLHPVRLP